MDRPPGSRREGVDSEARRESSPEVPIEERETSLDPLAETRPALQNPESSDVARVAGLRPGDFIGGADGRRFQIVGCLGSGAMGAVHLARDGALDRTVALKFITPTWSRASRADMAELFQLEARATARLAHENIVRIFDIGSEAGVPFLVMEHLEGCSLDGMLKERWDALRATKLIRDVARGLAHAHKAGVVHRDLKPSNIFILKDGRAKILDFGLSGFGHPSFSARTGRGSVVGTPGYMAPEQWVGQAQDGRTDLWAAGTLYFLLLTGTLPFPGADLDSLRRAVTSPDPAPSLRLFRPDLPEDAVRTLERALQKDVARRFGTAEELVDALVAVELALTHSEADAAGRQHQPRPERRQITLLSCALADPIGMAERMEPEDFGELVGGLFDACATIVRELEGAMVSQTGGRSVACFGYPEAHEDDAQRALRAAFLVRDAARHLERGGEVPAVRVGLDTGLAVAGRLRLDDPDAPTVIQGDVPETTSWLERRAGPGEILLTERTKTLLRGLFELEPLGSASPEGAHHPLELYRAVKLRDVSSRFAVAPHTRLAPLVGRDREAAQLRELWQRAKTGHGTIAFLTGEAGIGKSRLVEMLRQEITSDAHLALTAQCWSHFQNSALHPLVECLLRLTGIVPELASGEKLRKLEAALVALGMSPDEPLPVLATFLRVPLSDAQAAPPLSPDRFKSKLLEVIVSMLLAAADRTPTLFVIEDLHWSDASTQELIDLLLARVGEAPIMVIGTYRPEFQPIWSVRPNMVRLALPRLSARASADLVEQASPGQLPETIVTQLVNRSDGIPLFIEELVRAVAESGGKGQTIPSSLNELLQARLDRLMGGAKEIAQLGAVIGREFSFSLLRRAAALDEDRVRLGLMHLLESDLVRQERDREDPTYVFKHALVHEAAYGSLTRTQQRDHHRLVADVLAQHFPDVAEGQPELLAHHYVEASDDAKAITFLEKAGQLATKRAAVGDAETHYRRALGLLLARPESDQRDRDELRLQLALGAPLMAARGYANPDVRRTYGRARDLCQRAGDDSLLFDSVLGLWYFYMVGGEVATSVDLARQLLAKAEKSADEVFLMLAHRALGTSLLLSGDFDACRRHTAIGSSLYDRARHGKLILKYGQDPGVTNTVYLAWSLWYLGFPDQALKRAEDGLDLARTLEHPLNVALALNYVAHVCNYRGEHARARRLAEEASAISSEHQLKLWQSFSKIELGWALIGLGDDRLGGDLLKEGVAGWTKTGAKGGRTFFLAPLVWGQLRSGALDEAASTIEGIEGLIGQTGERLIEAELLRLRGEMMLLRGDKEEREIESLFVRGLTIARQQTARGWELRLAISLGSFWKGRGRHAEARELLLSSLAPFSEGLETADVSQARHLLASLPTGG